MEYVDIDTIRAEAERLRLTNKEYNYANMLLKEVSKFEDMGLEPKVIYDKLTGRYSVSSYEGIWGLYH